MKKIIVIALLVVMSFAIFVSCKKNNEEAVKPNYNAQVYLAFSRGAIDSEVFGIDGVKSEFLLSNRTFGIPSVYEEPETGKLLPNYDGVDEYPKQRYYIIKSEEAAEEIFKRIPEVDFETQMIVIVSFTTIEGGGGGSHALLNVFREESKLKIEIQEENHFNSIQPHDIQVVFGIIMDKLNGVSEVEIVLKQKKDKKKRSFLLL